jgi:hypothetical protein
VGHDVLKGVWVREVSGKSVERTIVVSIALATNIW